MLRKTRQPLSPAAILLFIRNQPGSTLAALKAEFAFPGQIGWSTDPAVPQRATRLQAILRNIEGAGLIGQTRASESDSQTPGQPAAPAWSATPLLVKLQEALELSLSTLAEARSAELSDSARELDNATELAKSIVDSDAVYGEDLAESLREMRISLEGGCFIAVMGLGGKVLEICLKQHMLNLGLAFDDNWMLGTLVSKLREQSGEYVDPSLGNIINIINQSRIPAVHAKRAIPIPSKHQADMVVAAVIDVLKRTILRPAGTSSNRE